MNYTIENQFISKEMRLVNDRLISGEIINKRSGTSFIPDGNGAQFSIVLEDGDAVSSKSLFVQSCESDGGKLVVTFKEASGFLCKLVYEIKDNDHFLTKQLSFTTSCDKKIDYIDLESYGLTNANSSWCAPEMEDTVGGVPGFYATLGQPIYIDSFFTGCEFPATENTIDTVARVRYYKGMCLKGETFTAPKTVFGAARSDDGEVLGQDFLAYIKTISTPGDFRIQYNSWYDHMLDITAQNIEKSFYEIEKGLTSHGIPPVDSYVVDDGWVDYKADFWKFNKKFPNELYDSSALAEKFSSRFGLWLGPRGGYSKNKPFGKQIEKAGTGNYNPASCDICVGSKVYQENLLKLFLDYMDRFDINYWKLDGFINKACPKADHGHVTGGFHDMYYITQTWERWIEIFKAMRSARTEKGKDLWINMTCYVNPSPWWLQWVNSVWLQNSGDIGFEKNVAGQRQVEQMLSYRDDRYFDFLQTRCHQFPLSSVYNHEPIYGNSAKISFTDEEFEKYMFMLTTRGTAFWELYFSYNMMNEAKWESAAKALKWAKANFHILRNSRIVGKTPAENEVYGYSCWTDSEGIFSLRNPSNKTKKYTVTLDKLFGVKESIQELHRFNVYNTSDVETDETFSCGDTFEVELEPFQVKIYQFGKKDNRFNYPENCNDFSYIITPAKDGVIYTAPDVSITVQKGKVVFKAGNTTLTTKNDAVNKKCILVREKNGMLKAYVGGVLDSSAYETPEKTQLQYIGQGETAEVKSSAMDFTVAMKPFAAEKKGFFAKLLGK